jgi:Protein of unknown function (DUF2510)
MPDAASTPVAGWYADPENAASDRWWDGSEWSQHRRAHAAEVIGYAPVIATLPAKNTLAMAGLVVAICSVPFSFIGFSFFALVGGIIAGLLSGAGLTRAKRFELAGIPASRRKIAIAGLVVGYGGAIGAFVWTVLSIVQLFGGF